MEKITSNIIKSVKRLSASHHRREEGLFVAERTKIVLELLNGPFELVSLIGTHAWFEKYGLQGVDPGKCLQATRNDMERMSSLATPPEVLAVFRLPQLADSVALREGGLYVALDGVRDPGNLGTIIRLADWFGLDGVIVSEDSADPYGPKAIQASMGSTGRVRVTRCDLVKTLVQAKENDIPLWGTFMDGTSIYALPSDTGPHGVIVMGNEGVGISNSISAILTERITIPTYPLGRNGAESLNVAMAASVVISEFRRRALSIK